MNYMKQALKEAQKAYDKGEVPVGCVIVYEDKIIARGHNLRETKQNALCHAEIIALNKAYKKIGYWRLNDCDIYITLEPCPMCSGAIIQSRIRHVYYGAYDKKGGCAESLLNLFDYPFNHSVLVTGGVNEEECRAIMSRFFQEIRKKR